MKILLAVDGSAYTKKMLAYLAAHDLFSAGNEYTTLAVHLALPPQARATLGKTIVQQYYDEECQRIMAPVDKFLLRHGVNAAALESLHHARANAVDRLGFEPIQTLRQFVRFNHRQPIGLLHVRRQLGQQRVGRYAHRGAHALA